jgi:DNA-binding NarL/FixJ family response regulator
VIDAAGTLNATGVGVVQDGHHTVAERGGGQPGGPALVRAVLVDVRAERRGVTRELMLRSGLVLVVGEADTMLGAIDVVASSSADLVVLEIQMPVEEGLATITALRQHFPPLRIVVCSFEQGSETRRRAQENGSDGYLKKPIDVGELRRLLRQYDATG